MQRGNFMIQQSIIYILVRYATNFLSRPASSPHAALSKFRLVRGRSLFMSLLENYHSHILKNLLAFRYSVSRLIALCILFILLSISRPSATNFFTLAQGICLSRDPLESGDCKTSCPLEISS
jgi:predicted small integral membrane protein